MSTIAQLPAIIFGVLAFASLPVTMAQSAGKTEIVISGTPDHGVFDPSIARSDSRRLYMSLSGVSSTAAGGSLGALAVRTLLAFSDDHGLSWQLVKQVVTPEIEVSLESFAAPHRGRWQSEVSALLFDPYASKDSRWKLFWHQYLNANGQRRFEHGWLAYKEAERPEDLASARAIKLFTALGYDDADNQTTGSTKPPISGGAVAQFQQLHKDLSRCAAVSEPGTLAKADGVYLALVCFEGSFLGLLGVHNRVVLLKCTRPCRPSEPGAWSYVGTLLTEADAKSLSMRKFSAADLYSGGDHDYLIVSPVGTVPGDGAYKGCAVFLFDRLDRGQIARDQKGQPRLHNYVQFGPETFNGACTVVPDGPHAGVIMAEVEFVRRAGSGIEPKFHIYGTGQRP